MTADADAAHGVFGSTEKPLPPPPGSSTNAGSQLTEVAASVQASDSVPNEVRPASIAARSSSTRDAPASRVRKKIPWKGKNILFCLPRDDKRGLPGNMPLSSEQIKQVYREWENLGYPASGWDLETPIIGHPIEDASQSRTDWPSPEDVARERKNTYKVTLPDLDAWAKYTADLQEAKLRALGVLTAAEVPIPATPSPAPSLMTHRRISTMQHPGQVYSPPIPTSSAGSFTFPHPFNRAGMSQSPGLNSAPTPVSINGHPAKYNARQSISIPSSHSPFQMNQPSPNWAQQSMMMQRGLHRAESPLGYSNVMSPTSPFQPTGSPAMNMHQRHQSMQYPMMSQPYQPMPSRGTPIMREVVQEEEEEEEEEEVIEPQKDDIVEPVEQEDLQQPQHPPGQTGETEDAEYHLEKQLMKDFEHSDYNPNNDDVGGMQQEPITNYAPESAHTRQQSSVQFAALPTTQFASNNTVLHHPRPHSRGHSLANNFYMGDKAPDGSDDSSSLANQLRSMTQAEPQPISTEFEESPTDQVAANVPASDFDFTKNVSAHQHTFSTMSNPWQDVASANRSSRQSSHGSKASFSKLNVEAPEFKFNPTSSFTPGSFNFGASTSSSTFEPFQGSSVAAVDMTPPSTKISAAATTFSPGQSDFSFPSFRPNAPAFVPLSQLQGQNETFTGSIFGTVSLADTVKSSRKSKAIPIVVPSDEKAQEEMSDAEDAEGRPTNHARAKRARAFGFGQSSGDEADSQPLFAEPKETPSEIEFNKTADEDDEAFTPAVDTSTLSSGVQSEPTDTKPSSANSPSGESIGQRAANWAPFEFESKQDMVNFSAARPFGDNWTPAPVPTSTTPTKKPGHKKSLSVTAKVFVPGATAYHTEPEAESEVECDVTLDPELEEAISEIEKYVSEADEVDATATPTPEMFPVQTLDEVAAASMPVPASISASTTARRLNTPNFPPPSGIMNSRFASPPRGLKASRFASPSPTRKGVDSDLGVDTEAELGPETSLEGQIEEGEILEDDEVVNELQSQESGLQAAPNDGDKEHTLTFEEIDDIMMNQMKNDPTQGVHKTISTSGWHQSKPNRHMSLAAVAGPSPYGQDFEQGSPYGSGSLSPARSKQVVQLSGENFEEDEFVDPPRSGTSFAGPIHRLNGRRHESEVPSDWDGMFAGDDERKLAPRAAFFDGRVNQIVDEVLAARLQPLERALDTIQDSLFSHGQRRSRSLSDDIQPSDADDEDDEPMPVCPVSPRKDKRMELIRSAVSEAFAQQQQTSLLGMSTEAPSKSDEMQARILDLEQRLHLEESRVHKEINDRRAAEDRAADFERNLLSVESRLANELAQRANIESRCADLETKLHHEEARLVEQVTLCHAAQDEAAEAQRLMRISTKEETRLLQLSDEQSHKIKSLEQDLNKATMRMTLLEAAQDNSSQSQGADSARLATLETELEAARRDVQMWRAEAGSKTGLAQKHEEHLVEAQAEVKQLHKVLATLGTQLEENERIRENWRNKFISLQQDMTSASHQITEENARRTKHEHALLARQDVLDAKLQAEACTRERLEKELERLEGIERQGMRAINDNKRLEELLAEMRTENHKLQQAVMRHRLEFEEARESGANEVQRIRISMQNQLDEANMQVNVARVELEENIAALRSELDNVKLDADSSKARTEMMVEDANETKDRAIKELTEKYSNEIEDLHTRYQHKLSLVSDEAQTREQLLLERLSLSTSKTEHLQDRIIHLEDKLEIAKQAAAAAAQQATRNSGAITAATGLTTASSSRRGNELPEKISPQALRESIMVLQEQLQAREHRIEELEEATANLDPDMEAKITKRDDEIVWLRELLAVRHADLQDVIGALSADTFDRERVKDAAIRLKANLQMEEQERERAMNGGSAIKLPRLARTFTEAATPRVAQAVGPLAAAWGNWRKGQPAFGGIRPTPSVTTVSSNTVSMGKKSAAASAATTPTSVTTPEFASAPGLTPAASSSLLSGLLTPPATGSRVLSGTRIGASGDDKPQQPTAFSVTGRRFTSGTHSQLTVNRTRGLSSEMKTAEIAGASTPPRELRTPPMMKAHDYDPDAQMNGFDDEDDDFFED